LLSSIDNKNDSKQQQIQAPNHKHRLYKVPPRLQPQALCLVFVSIFELDDDTWQFKEDPVPLEEGEVPIVDYIRGKVLIDSGASDHMTGDASKVDSIEPYLASVILPNSAVISCTQRGIMRVKFYSQTHQRHFTVAMLDTLIVPGLRLPLVSATKLSESGHDVLFNKSGIQLTLCTDSPRPLILHLPRPFCHPGMPSSSHVVVHHPTEKEANTAQQQNLLHAARFLCNMYDDRHKNDDDSQPPQDLVEYPCKSQQEKQERLIQAYHSSIRSPRDDWPSTCAKQSANEDNNYVREVTQSNGSLTHKRHHCRQRCSSLEANQDPMGARRFLHQL
jgi:hypothetical protein